MLTCSSCGCSKTPIGALLIGEILSKCNLPEGSFSILPCSRDGADLFTTDDRFKLLSFTGSPAVRSHILHHSLLACFL